MGNTPSVYDGKWPGLPPFELHLGPFHDFALFRGIQDEYRDHTSTDNLLHPPTLQLSGGGSRQTWDVGGLHMEVTLAGGSSDARESWYLLLRRSTVSPASH